ncbi:uncharacterized protein BCR38DRAFT_451211 [Pseudomassariella vexata]|uniref:Uncharacterized protein n=1 Tax=Pseudomassariella vexata TaxID=1141098 RepID=A0A1Y2DAT9_9PEZI|nr:uncharacterized protein BCR38DRAFT_451211 [Pseudomassariella vexata]ORY56380.1 hypothetical protein BCR38DRAFT_451211 [Pseudomassariella vexata]
MDAPTESGGSGKDKGDCGPAPSSSRTASPPVDDDSYLPQAQGAHEYRDRRDQTPTPRRSPFLPDEAGATESQHEPSSDIVRERSEQSAQSPQHIPYDLNPWQKDAETSSQRTLKAASEPGDAASPAYGSPGPSASAAEEADESRAAADEVDAVADADAGAETEAGPSAQDDPDVQDSDDDSHQTTLSSGSSTIPNTLVVDPDTDPDSDGDSALGATPLISTTSLASTLLRSVEEYGRTYHKYKQGSKYRYANSI